MPHVVLSDERVLIGLEHWECLAAMRRPFTVARGSITTCELVERPFRSLRGIRAPGTWIPGVLAYGTYRHPGGKDFVAVIRSRPAVRVVLRGEEYAQIMLSLRHPDRLEDELA